MLYTLLLHLSTLGFIQNTSLIYQTLVGSQNVELSRFDVVLLIINGFNYLFLVHSPGGFVCRKWASIFASHHALTNATFF